MNASASKRPESVLVVVYSKTAQVLLLRRHEPPAFWQSAAGSLEWGEEPAEAALREVREETGLARTPEDCGESSEYQIYRVWRHRYAPGVLYNREHVFRLQVPEACAVHLDAREHAEYVWLPRAAAAGRVFSPSNRAAILKWVPEDGH